MRKLMFGLLMLSVLMLACGGTKPLPNEAPPSGPAASEEQTVADIDQQIAQLDTDSIDTAELDAMADDLDLSDI